MIKIKLREFNEEWEFEGLKLVWCDNPNLFHKWILEEIDNGNFELNINSKEIKTDKIIHINEYTKLKDLLNFNKNNMFIHYVLEQIGIDNLFDLTKLEQDIENINVEIGNDFLSLKNDQNKLLQTLIEINSDVFLNLKDFLFFLNTNELNDEKFTFIINDVSWLKIDGIKRYVNIYNFIFLTNDVRKQLINYDGNNIDNLIVNFNENKFIDFIDVNKINEYLENVLNIKLSSENYVKDIFLGKNYDFDHERLLKIIKKC